MHGVRRHTSYELAKGRLGCCKCWVDCFVAMCCWVQILVSCTKGILNDTLETPHDILRRVLPERLHPRWVIQKCLTQVCLKLEWGWFEGGEYQQGWAGKHCNLPPQQSQPATS